MAAVAPAPEGPIAQPSAEHLPPDPQSGEGSRIDLDSLPCAVPRLPPLSQSHAPSSRNSGSGRVPSRRERASEDATPDPLPAQAAPDTATTRGIGGGASLCGDSERGSSSSVAKPSRHSRDASNGAVAADDVAQGHAVFKQAPHLAVLRRESSLHPGKPGLGSGKLPHGQLRVHVATWNMGAKLPTAGGDKDSAALDDALGELLGLEDVPDIIAVGSQESGALPAWEQMVLERLGDGYHLVGRQTLGALGLMVFTSAELHGRVGTVAADSVLAGAKQTVNFTATKGGVGISVALRGGPRLLFVNSHLTAQVRNVQQRNDDYHTIKRGLLRRALSNFKTATEAAGGSAGHHWHRPRDATKGHDLTIWLGDLNYRIMANRDAADRALSLGLPEVLLGNDQLRREQRHRRAFVHFQEGGIEFPPTYKYDPGTDKYDTSKKARVPSWTDRILFKTEHRLRGHEPVVKRYTCVSALKSSDHRPVVATLEVGLAPWEHARHDGAGGERGRSGAGWQTRRRVSQMPMASRKIRGRIAPEVIPPSLDTASTAVVVEQSPEAERSS